MVIIQQNMQPREHASLNSPTTYISRLLPPFRIPLKIHSHTHSHNCEFGRQDCLHMSGFVKHASKPSLPCSTRVMKCKQKLLKIVHKPNKSCQGLVSPMRNYWSVADIDSQNDALKQISHTGRTDSEIQTVGNLRSQVPPGEVHWSSRKLKERMLAHSKSMRSPAKETDKNPSESSQSTESGLFIEYSTQRNGEKFKKRSIIPLVCLTKIESKELETSDSSFELTSPAIQKSLDKKKRLVKISHKPWSDAFITCEDVIHDYKLASAEVLSSTDTLVKRRNSRMAIPERLFKHVHG